MRIFSEQNGFNYFGTLTCYREVNQGGKLDGACFEEDPASLAFCADVGTPTGLENCFLLSHSLILLRPIL